MSGSRRPDLDDRLPPHSEEAEAGVLGCIMLEPYRCLAEARQAFGVTQPFYAVKHAALFQTLSNMADERVPIDSITVIQRLTDMQRLEAVGGIAYIATLPDAVPSAANVTFYIQIVREKFALRQGIARAQQYIARAFGPGDEAGLILTEAAEGFAAVAREATSITNPNAMPPHVKTCADFADQFHQSFYGADCEEPGLPLPFAHENFPLRIRGGELTIVLGEKGVGKSTILSWIQLWLMHRGMKAFVASMEMKPEITLKIGASQLLGRNKFEDSPENHKQTSGALAWLNSRMVIYDFLGIADWREVLASMRYAATFLGCNLFVIDSMMRLGIMDDDYAQQGACVMAFASFSLETNSHVFLVNHLNKASDKSAKNRSRGSQQIIDNANNVVNLTRNESKGEKLAELWAKRVSDLAAGKFDQMEFQGKLDALSVEWDSKFVLTNQRLPGSRQNGSIYLFFHRESQQMRSSLKEAVGVNYLERWTKGGFKA